MLHGITSRSHRSKRTLVGNYYYNPSAASSIIVIKLSKYFSTLLSVPLLGLRTSSSRSGDTLSPFVSGLWPLCPRDFSLRLPMSMHDSSRSSANRMLFGLGVEYNGWPWSKLMFVLMLSLDNGLLNDSGVDSREALESVLFRKGMYW